MWKKKLKVKRYWNVAQLKELEIFFWRGGSKTLKVWKGRRLLNQSQQFMNIIDLLLGNFLLFTLYACTPSLFKPTAKIAYSRWIFAEILERCTWLMSMSANKSRKWKNCILLISLPVFILKIPKEKTEKKHIQYRWLEK